MRYVTGGHAAALAETQWPHTAESIVNDTIPAPPDSDNKPDQSELLRIVAGISNACFAAGLVLALSPVYFLLRDVPGLNGLAAAGHAAAAFVYMLGLWFVVTRV